MVLSVGRFARQTVQTSDATADLVDKQVYEFAGHDTDRTKVYGPCLESGGSIIYG